MPQVPLGSYSQPSLVPSSPPSMVLQSTESQVGGWKQGLDNAALGLTLYLACQVGCSYR